jgi:hypothetical protein
MKNIIRLLFILTFLFLQSGFTYKRIDFRDGMQNNVCKTLKNNVLVYFIFIDTKDTSPWTEFDIRSTIDSMEVAVKWLEKMARENGIALNIITDYYIGNEYTTIRKNLPSGNVITSAVEPNFKQGLEGLNKWADNIAKRAGEEIHIVEKDGIPEIKNPKNKERLVAHLRDERQVESVALIYMVNNYFRNDISIPVNHLDTDDVEFAIVSYKYPAVIAQNILNLFGAADLSKTLYRRNEKKIKLAKEFFPQDIMQDVYGKSITECEIGELTQYLIGWKPTLAPKYHQLLTDKVVNF